MAPPRPVRPPRELIPRGHRAVVALGALTLLSTATLTASDVGLYHSYGVGLLHGRLPAEYPAAAAFVFLGAVGTGLPYTLGFALLMAVALAALYGTGRRLLGTVWADRLVCYLAAGTVAVLFSRFDLVPALATFLAVQRARSGRWRSAWGWAVVGGLVKIFPLVLLPGFLLAERRDSGRTPWRRAAAAAGVLAAVVSVQQLLAPGTVVRPLSYELRRGFEFSSLPGTLSLLTAPAHLRFAYAFRNHQVTGAHPGAVSLLLLLGVLAALGAVWSMTARGRLPVDAASLAALSAVVLAGKSLAPQYFVWLAPLWALWPLRRSWLAAAALTTLVYPVLFVAAGGGSLYLDTVVAGVRNAVLAAGTVAWLAEGLRARWWTAAPVAAGSPPPIHRPEMEAPCPAVA